MSDRPRGETPGGRIGRLYDRHASGLYRYALMITADPAAAADAVQQVFVALLRRSRDFDAEHPYLRRAVRNECYSLLRRRRLEPVAGDAPLLDAVAARDDRPDIRIALEEAIRTLSAEQREWLPPAAAAAAAIVFSILAAGARANVASQLSEIDRAREAMVTELTTALGGDEVAEALARRLVAIEEQTSNEEAPTEPSAPA